MTLPARDVFVFNELADFQTDSGAVFSDTILDFVHGEDKLEFKTFDADPTIAGVQDVDFRFIGSNEFIKGDRSIGELRFSGSTLLGDCNNDGNADFSIKMLGVSLLTSTDLLL